MTESLHAYGTTSCTGTRAGKRNQLIKRLTATQLEVLLELWRAGKAGITVDGPGARTDHFQRLVAYGYADGPRHRRHVRVTFRLTLTGKQRLLDPMRLLEG